MKLACTSGTPAPAAALPRLSNAQPTLLRPDTPTPRPPANATASPRLAAAPSANTSTLMLADAGAHRASASPVSPGTRPRVTAGAPNKVTYAM